MNDTPTSLIQRPELLPVLRQLDLGASVAEVDALLYDARVETGTFWDLYKDSVDLIPGSKGSGKSALFQLFVKHLDGHMRDQKKVILAHGVQSEGDQVFRVFANSFEKLNNSEFHNFWCIYFVSLVNEVLLKQQKYAHLVEGCESEIGEFKRECAKCRIPDIEAPQTLRGMLEWCFNAVYRKFWPSRISFGADQMALEFDHEQRDEAPAASEPEPIFIEGVRQSLENLLRKADITIWLMLDKLDEIFPRWSQVEKTGLSALLRAMYAFRSDRIRVKIFLRDDIFEHLVSGEDGFPGLTHIAARMASPLRWAEEDILQLITKRLYAGELANLCEIDRDRMEANKEYRQECLYKAMPLQVHTGSRQSRTLNWIYTHCQDGRKVVAPRDVVDLLIATKDAEIQSLESNTDGTSHTVFSPASLLSGFAAMSRRKRNLFLEAEFPHFRETILQFQGGAAIHSPDTLSKMFGKKTDEVVDKLVKIGFLYQQKRAQAITYSIPFLYRPAFDIRQTSAS